VLGRSPEIPAGRRTGEPMRILMLAHRIPYPPHTGDKVRAFHIARHLARKHEVTLGFLVDDAGDGARLGELRRDVSDLMDTRLPRPWALLRGVTRLASGGSASLGYFGSRGLLDAVTRRLRDGSYDLVYLSSSPMAQYVAGDCRVPVVMDFVDVDSDKWAQYAERTSFPLSRLYALEGRRLRAHEAAVARRAHLCLVATPAEEALLRSFAPWARSAVVPNGVDLGYYRPSGEEPGEPALVFTGAMDYLPNVDAALHLCEDILPEVRREVPAVRLHVVGLNPPPSVVRLSRIPGVVVTGAVPDVRPYYARAQVCVAPLRIARGVQNKILQGMAMGLPVVATGPACRGLEAEPGRHLHVADDPTEFAGRVAGLLRSPGERRRMGLAARAFVEAHHPWESSLARLDRLLDAVVAAGSDRSGATA
jgi:polysaccharide biosynthesis protein PslH